MKKKKSGSKSAFFNLRTLLGLVLVMFGAVLSLYAAGALSTPTMVTVSQTAPTQIPGATSEAVQTQNGPAYVHRDFQEATLTKHDSAKIDLRTLPFVLATPKERRELDEPEPAPRLFVPQNGPSAVTVLPRGRQSPAPSVPDVSAPAPATSIQFDGLDFATWGAGHP